MILSSLSSRANLIVGLICLLLIGCSGAPESVELRGATMGTTYSVKVIGPVNEDLLKHKVEERLQEVNQLMSTYIASSEISRLNQSDAGTEMRLSPENLAMFELSNRLHLDSGGKFDPTLGPLISLWGFGADPHRRDVPPQAEIDAALGKTGMDALEVKGEVVTKNRPVAIDFSAIAKGYGVDELARLIEEAGGTNYLVEIGGELRARGKNAQGRVWRIGVETPDVAERKPYTALPLVDLAMATSGDYRNYFEVDGKRFSHTLDPATGFPITHNVASVTVLAETTAAADGYATAINVMGLETGMALAIKNNLIVLVILKGEDGFETKTSPAFDAYMAAQAG